MKNKERFATYEQARGCFDAVAPIYGITRMDWGFGRWLWLDYNEDRNAYWKSMEEAGILTADGRKKLALEIKKAEVKQ